MSRPVRQGRRHITYYTTVIWDCVHFESIQAVQEIRRDLADLDVQVFEIDGARIGREEELYTQISAEMRFPFTVTNPDGLNDFLRGLDYEFQPDGTLAPGQPNAVILIVRDARFLWDAAPLVAGLLVECWLFSAEYWSNVHVAFHLVFEM